MTSSPILKLSNYAHLNPSHQVHSILPAHPPPPQEGPTRPTGPIILQPCPLSFRSSISLDFFQARDSLLLCISLASRSPAVESYIAGHSNFLPILASGLSGLYSALPRGLGADHPAWHRLDPGDTQVGQPATNQPSPGHHQHPATDRHPNITQSSPNHQPTITRQPAINRPSPNHHPTITHQPRGHHHTPSTEPRW